MRKLLTVFIAIVMASYLAACSKEEPPKCSDERTIRNLKKLILGEMSGLENYLTEKEIQDNFKIELPVASEYDEKIVKYSCEARLVAANVYQRQISYSSQLDDKGQAIISVIGLGRGEINGIRMLLISSVQKSRPKPTPEMVSNCINIEMAKWEKHWKEEIRELCEPHTKVGEECLGSDELENRRLKRKQMDMINIEGHCAVNAR